MKDAITLEEFLRRLRNDATWLKGFGAGIKGALMESGKALEARAYSIEQNINLLEVSQDRQAIDFVNEVEVKKLATNSRCYDDQRRAVIDNTGGPK